MRTLPSTAIEPALDEGCDSPALSQSDRLWNEFWAPGQSTNDVDDRPTLRPTGEQDSFDVRELVPSGVHRILAPRDGSDVESIEGALRKLIAG
jgi:hypothetical protein